MLKFKSPHWAPCQRISIGVLAWAAASLWSAAAGMAGDPPVTIEIPMTGKADPRLAPFDDLMVEFIRSRDIPGAALAVTRQGRLVYARGFGYADLESKTPVEPRSLFRVASISKPVTAVAILRLVEAHKLSLDDTWHALLAIDPPPTDAAPDARLKEITIRQLLEHTGGWDRDQSFDPMFRSVEIAGELGAPPPAGPEQVIRYMMNKPLDFSPGERYAYSNFGYCLLGRIIERISGQSYEAYVMQHVLLPLGITSMRLGKTLRGERAEGEVTYYETQNTTGPAVVGDKIGEPVPSPYGAWYLEAMDSHGGWIASAVDLVRFAAAFDDPDQSPLLGRDAVSAMFARPQGPPGLDADGHLKDFYYGLGWFVRPVGSGERANHWHTGSLPGTSTILVGRHDGLDWAVLFNTRNGPGGEAPSRAIDPLVHQAADAVTEWPDEALEIP